MDGRKLIIDNWSIKLVSLALAVSLWLFVTSKGKMEISLTVPLELQNIPAGMAVVGNVVRYLDVRLQGPERVMRDIGTGRKVVCLLNLGPTKAGENRIRVSPDDIRRPEGITVTHLAPYEIDVMLEALQRRTVRMRPVLYGVPAPGYRVTEVSSNPARVTAEGPASVMRMLTDLRTMPIDIQGATDTVTVEPRIDTEGKPIKLIEKNVTIRINIRKGAR